MKRTLATAAALLAVVILALPWVLGAQSQRVYDTALSRLQEQGVRVLDSRYRRGWFSSDATVRIELPPSAGQALDAGAIPLRIDLRDFRAQAEGSRWIGALHTGEGAMSLERAELRAPDASLLAVGLSATGKTVPVGQLLSMELAYRVDELSVNGAAYGPSQVSLSVRRLPGDALASFQQAMQGLSAGSLDGSIRVVAMAAILVEHLPLLLADDPQLILDPVEISTPEGVIRGRLSLASQGLTSRALERSGAWLEHLVGEGELSLPRPLLLRLLEGWQRGRLMERLQRQGQETPTLPETFETEIATAARDRLDVLVHQGWLAEEAGGMAVRARLADALLTINGKTVPVGTAAVP